MVAPLPTTILLPTTVPWGNLHVRRKEAVIAYLYGAESAIVGLP